MKSIIIFNLIVFVFVQCQSRKSFDNNKVSKNSNSVITSKKDSIISLKGFLSLNCLASDALAIDNDTIQLIKYSTFKFEKKYYVEQYWFDLNYSFDTNHYRTNHISKKNISPFYDYLKTKPIFFKNIGTLNVEYQKMPIEIQSKLASNKIYISETKVQKFDNKYYFIDTVHSMNIFIYNPQNDLLISLQVVNDYFNIKDFFVYDLVGDKRPEIFIFSWGRRYEKDHVGFDAYVFGN